MPCQGLHKDRLEKLEGTVRPRAISSKLECCAELGR